MGEAKHRMTVKPPSAAHKGFHVDFAALLKKHFADENADVLLAIASYAVGQLVALQDQRKLTPAMAMEIVARNIEAGNADAIGGLDNTRGNA